MVTVQAFSPAAERDQADYKLNGEMDAAFTPTAAS